MHNNVQCIPPSTVKVAVTGALKPPDGLASLAHTSAFPLPSFTSTVGSLIEIITSTRTVIQCQCIVMLSLSIAKGTHYRCH